MNTILDWSDFNNATVQTGFTLIPRGTIAKVAMHIKPGMYNYPESNANCNYATRNEATGTIYLSSEFVILQGQYKGRKIWSKIGLYSPKSEFWGKMGHAFIGDILNSAFGISRYDHSTSAQNTRKINGFETLQGIEFVALIDVEKDKHSNKERNVIKQAITCDHKEYKNFVGKMNSECVEEIPWEETE